MDCQQVRRHCSPVLSKSENKTSRENKGQEFIGKMVNPTKHALEKVGHQQNLHPPSHKISTACPQSTLMSGAETLKSIRKARLMSRYLGPNIPANVNKSILI